MTREEIKQRMNELLGLASAEHQAKASEILTGLSDEFEKVLNTSEYNARQVTEFTERHETLRDVNAKLFLKVGATDKETPKTETANVKTVESENTITFDNLFNEKGELI